MLIQNATRGRHIAVPIKDKSGRPYLVAILKFTFAVSPSGKVDLLGAEGADPDLADTYNGDDAAKSSIRKPSQVFDAKPGTDVILVGHAQPPLKGARADVSLRFGPIAKTVRAHGPRVWQLGAFGGITPGPALPLRDPVPLVYELAWGGCDLSIPEKPVGEPRNYVGRGVAADRKSLVGQPAAQLEHPDHPIGGRDNVPWCFGAIHRHWQPRASFAGTYDEAWMATKMPLLPDDFDARFNVSVAPEQWSPAPLRGDEPCEIQGALPGVAAWRFQLPRLAPGFSSLVGGRTEDHRTHLDTVFIDADLGRVELTWRAAVPLPRKYEMLERVRMVEKGFVS